METLPAFETNMACNAGCNVLGLVAIGVIVAWAASSMWKSFNKSS